MGFLLLCFSFKGFDKSKLILTKNCCLCLFNCHVALSSDVFFSNKDLLQYISVNTDLF